MRVFVTAVLCFTASALVAQNAPTSPIAKGSRLISGTASITSTSSDGGSGSLTSVSFNPNVLWFVRDRVAVGGELGLGYQDGDGFSGTSWLIGPAARFFFAEPAAKLLPFVGVSVGFGRMHSESGTFEFTGTQRALELVGGATQMLARNVGLTGELFVQRTNFEVETGTTMSDNTTTMFGLRFGVSAFLF